MLQPLLNRKKQNKHLSEIERKLAEVMIPAGPDTSGSVDQCALLLSYFYDDFLSEALRKAAKEFGVPYLDLNAEIAPLGSDVEFYTDYCHLTPEGNRRVAEILGRAILAGDASRRARTSRPAMGSSDCPALCATAETLRLSSANFRPGDVVNC